MKKELILNRKKTNNIKFNKFILTILCVCLLLGGFMSITSNIKAVEIKGYTAISSKEDFYNIRNNTNGKYYLTTDITFEEIDYTSLGDFSKGFTAFDEFYGTIDGCGHTISGLNSDFGIAADNYGTIKNLEFNSCEFSNNGFVYINQGEITNCKITDSTIGIVDFYSKETLGGIAYLNDSNGLINYCSTSNCVINGSAGIVVRNEGKVDYCFNYSDFSHNYYDGAAGIAHYNHDGEITNCINYGNIQISGGNAAGICGGNCGIIENCANYSKVITNAGSSSAAGISCSLYTASSTDYIKNCLNVGEVSSKTKEKAFGIAPSSAGQSFSCINIGKVKANSQKGYAITNSDSPYMCYYLKDTGIGEGTIFNTSQVNTDLFDDFDFDNTWTINNKNPALRCEEEFQTAITAYQYPEKTNYWRGNKLDLSDMIVFSLNSKGTWYELYEDEYEVSGYNPKTLGKQTITISKDDSSFSFNIYVYDKIGNQNIKLSPSSFEYSGEKCKPSIIITDCATKKRLTVGKDYKMEYKNNLNVGTAYVEIEGLGYYDGTFKKEFKIKPKNIKEATVSIIPKELTYTGKYLKPSVEVSIEGVELVKDRDYTVSYKNNKNAGKATVTINGKGNYTGKIEKTFKIKPQKISSAKISSLAESINHTGKAIKPSFKVKVGSLSLEKNTDFTVSYKDNKKVGKATIIITGKGNYKGTKKIYFDIIPKTTKVSKLTAATKSLKVKIAKQSSQVTGYEIQYSTSKKFTKSTTKSKKITSYKTTSVTLKSLKAKKTYYVRVRTYKTVDGKKYYSDWSSYKSKKTK